jgi:HSP20 family protein
MMDRWFDDWRPFDDIARWGGANFGSMLALDVHEDEKAYTVSTELPGVKPENIQVRQEGDYLVIEAEIPEQTTERKEAKTLVKERRYGSFSRRLHLPSQIDFNAAEANYNDGVLTLTLPKAPDAQPKLIPVKATKK